LKVIYNKGCYIGSNGIDFFQQPDGSIKVYLSLRDIYWVASLNITAAAITPIVNPVQETPTGTEVWAMRSQSPITYTNELGNLGVGTANPLYRLEVNGSFAATTKSFVINHPTKTGYRLRYG
jgi:hypothetical protein